MSLGDKFTSGYRGINAFNSGVIKLLVARENDWIEEKLSAILTQSPRIDFRVGSLAAAACHGLKLPL
ncbi:hypothetical protein ACLVZU_004554 [Escherichia coli]